MWLKSYRKQGRQLEKNKAEGIRDDRQNLE